MKQVNKEIPKETSYLRPLPKENTHRYEVEVPKYLALLYNEPPTVISIERWHGLYVLRMPGFWNNTRLTSMELRGILNKLEELNNGSNIPD